MALVQRVSAHRLEEMPDRSVAVLGELNDPTNRYFTDVLVMADDSELRRARLALVQRIAALLDGIADLSQLQGFWACFPVRFAVRRRCAVRHDA